MKKLLAILLAALMVLSLAACSMEGGSSEPAKTEETTAAPETTETETEQPAEETAAPEVKADADITIAVVPKSLDNAISLTARRLPRPRPRSWASTCSGSARPPLTPASRSPSSKA